MSILNLDRKESGWLVRLALAWYMYWRVDHQHLYPPSRSENLCHFVRVLLIWAPLKWFFTHRYGKVSPYQVVAVALLIAAIALGLIRQPNITLAILKAIAIVALIISALALWVRGLRNDNPLAGGLLTAIIVLTWPIWKPISLLRRPANWFFTHRINGRWTRPWMYPLAALFLYLLFVPGLNSIIAQFVLQATLLYSLVFGLGALLIGLGKRQQRSSANKPASSLRFAWEAAKTLKHNTICPYIRIKGIDY